MATRLRIAWHSFLVTGLLAAGAIGPARANCPGQVQSEDSTGLPCELQQQQEQEQRQYQQQQGQQQGEQEWQDTLRRQQSQQQANVAQGQQVLRTWQNRPPLAPAHNPLLGRWNALGTAGATQQNTRNLAGTVGPEMAQLAASLLGGMTAGLCDNMLGSGVVEFGPNYIAAIGRDGRAQLLYHASYRGGGSRVVVLPTDAGTFTHMIIDFDQPGHGVVAGVGCVIARGGSAAATTTAQTRSGAGAGAGSAAAVTASLTTRTASAGGASGGAILNLTAGENDHSGQFQPLPAHALWVMKGSADMALIDGGLRQSPYGSMMHTFMDACRQHTPDCQKGLNAINAKTVTAVRTDSAGHAHTPAIPVGRYYVFGTLMYDNKPMVWQEPIDLRPGGNTLTLDLKNAYPVD